MGSVIGWLDYSEEQRQKMREVIDLFRDEDSVDELGVGTIQTTLADLLFPGLSTIQTRARYFLFVPWVYRQIEQERVPSSHATSKARRLQTDLVHAMERSGVTSGEGVFGWTSRDRLQRLPAEVYWAGLRTYGVRHFEGSIEDYHRSLDSYHELARDFNRGEGDELADTFQPNWTSRLPGPPKDLWEETPIEMTEEEAHFLLDQVTLSSPRSLLTWFLEHPNPHVRDIDLPWDHPAAPAAQGPCAAWLEHARMFSEVMYGVAISYNLMLALQADRVGLEIGSQDLGARYQTELEVWVDHIGDLADDVVSWNLEEFWTIVRTQNPRLHRGDEHFASAWIQMVKEDVGSLAALTPGTEKLISDRELQKKRAKARLHHHRALEMWSGRSGLRRLTYRWPTARVFIDDIHKGLGHV